MKTAIVAPRNIGDDIVVTNDDCFFWEVVAAGTGLLDAENGMEDSWSTASRIDSSRG
jgi:hypothetical protein